MNKAQLLEARVDAAMTWMPLEFMVAAMSVDVPKQPAYDGPYFGPCHHRPGIDPIILAKADFEIAYRQAIRYGYLAA